MDSDDETEEIEAKPIVKKSGFAAFQMDDSEDNQATDSDEEAPVITKVWILCFRFSPQFQGFIYCKKSETISISNGKTLPKLNIDIWAVLQI